MRFVVVLLFFVVILAFPVPTLAQTREERAVYNLCEGLNPGDLCPETPAGSKGFFQSLVDALYQLFFSKPANIDKLYDQGKGLGAGNAPKEVLDNALGEKDRLNKSLGTSWGLFGSELPKFSDVDQETRRVEDDERGYQKGNFPEGVNPFFEVAKEM